MSLTGAIQIARSALTTSQLNLQVASQNLANIANPHYTRQTALLEGVRGQASDRFMPGRGVQIRAIQRQVDNALQARLRNGIAEEQAAAQRLNVASQLESVLSELTGFDLSTQLNDFFSAWSDAANLINSSAVVIEQGDRVASFIRSMRSDLSALREQIESNIDANIAQADAIISEIASVNAAIAASGPSNASANPLRDRRDELVNQLSSMMNVSVVEDAQGNYDVFVGSTPVVLGGLSRGLEIERVPDGDQLSVRVRVRDDQSPIAITSGSIGGLLETRNSVIDTTIARLDTLSSQLIFEVNKLHSTGASDPGLRSITAAFQVLPSDLATPFNSPSNTTFAGNPFAPKNGGFFVEVKNSTTGATQRVRINVDLDGLNASGMPGTEDDATPASIATSLNNINGLSASFGPDGKLRIAAAPGLEFRFADDSSGVLASLGVNAYFTGSDARSISVNPDLVANPSRLTLGSIENNVFVQNGTALAIVDLQNTKLGALNGFSLQGHWAQSVQNVAVESSSTETLAYAKSVVRQSLEAQRASVSGVSADEESINLINSQQQYEAAARVISLADEMLRTLMSLV
ncbi:MAG: flagellar hook-associated protein FlgK [Phycisphaeraceae bacterium]|nr:flagellar hook-associated protein FlgK [Phycisphaeraceae bacterium]MCW5763996.1 flagellar hook-associated protein FlgK [Phycisphaeraceae bacterium]